MFQTFNPGIYAYFEFREGGRFSTRDRSRSQTPVPPESAREKRVVWKNKNDLCRCVFYARKISTVQIAGLDKCSNFHFTCLSNLGGEIHIQMPNQKADAAIGPKKTELQLALIWQFGGPIRALVFDLAIGFKWISIQMTETYEVEIVALWALVPPPVRYGNIRNWWHLNGPVFRLLLQL